MQTEFTEDQEQFREVVALYAGKITFPRSASLIAATEAAYDSKVWQQMSGEIGLTGVHFPEEFGGFGYGPVELGIVSEEMGRFLYCGPFLHRR